MRQAKNKGVRIQHKVERKINVGANDTNYVTFTSKIRAVGNSNGVILNNTIMEITGLSFDTDIIIHAEKDIITIKKAELNEINTDLSTWDKHFKQAIKRG